VAIIVGIGEAEYETPTGTKTPGNAFKTIECKCRPTLQIDLFSASSFRNVVAGTSVIVCGLTRIIAFLTQIVYEGSPE
jgi:hypothetical protein